MERKTLLLKRYVRILALGGLLAAAGTVCLPYGISPDCRAGLSAARGALLALILAAVVFLLWLASRLRPASAAAVRALAGLDQYLSGPDRCGAAMFGFGLAALISGHFLLNAFSTSNHTLAPYLVRLSPAAFWLLFLAGETLVFIPLYDTGRWKTQARAPGWRRWKNLLAGLLVLSAAWLPRAFALDRFVAVDEPTWEARGANFYTALRQKDFAATYQSEHPGVVLMWAETLALNLRLPKFGDLVDGPIGPGKFQLVLDSQSLPRTTVLSSARPVIAALCALAIAATFVLSQEVLGFWPALAGSLLLAFDPFHIALSRLLAMDAMLASWMGLSVMAFLHAEKKHSRPALIASGVAAGLSWLTKSPGFFLVPLVVVLAVAGRVAGLAGGSASGDWRAQALDLFKKLLVWGLTAAAVFVCLFPAMWAAPLATLGKMFSAALDYASEGHQGLVFWDGRLIPDGQIRDFWFYPATFLWRTTPVVLAGLLAAAAGLFIHGLPGRPRRRDLLGLFGTALLLLLLLNLGAKRFDRYFLPVYPLLDLTAGAGLVVLARRAGRPGVVVLAALAGLQVWLAAGVHPYYLSYYNPLLGGPARAPDVMMIGWGEGLNEAAAYLNARPGAENLRVVSWYNQGSFSYFFAGSSQHLPTNQELDPQRLNDILQMDYAVIYIHQWQRRTPQNLLEVLSAGRPEYSVWIDGLEYARVYALGED